MPTKYVDTSSIIQIIGNIFLNPQLIDNENYFFTEADFPEEFHRIVFGAIYNLYKLGAKEININTIEDYLEPRPKAYGVYQLNKGSEYLLKIADTIKSSAFDYYYSRMKKMTLLRMYNEKCGMDLSWLYDVNNLLDVKKKQQQEDWLDNTPISEIADLIDKKILDIRLKYVDDSDNEAVQAGDELDELLDQLAEAPEIGVPLYGRLINTITRGARLKKVYLRSAPTGVGKTRSMIADACYIACDEMYDINTKQWISIGTMEPTLFISTEQEKSEIQTMMLAFISGVNEEHILTNFYTADEWERIIKAKEIIKRSPLFIQSLFDFSLQDIENAIKKGINDNHVRYVFHDYIHSSMKILSEISSKAGVKNLREDNILFMISVKMKDIANQYGVFILTATQLNGSYTGAEVFDQNLLRGAKAIADKVDVGMILLEVTTEDLEVLKPLIEQGLEVPAIKISVYKNRRGRYKGILIWAKENRGTCRVDPIFVTNYQYELIPVDDIKIKVKSIMNKEGTFDAI